MKEARLAPPPVAPVEAKSALKFSPLLYSMIFFLTKGSFCNILTCNLPRYYICSSCY
jgi:hypothetical protein